MNASVTPLRDDDLQALWDAARAEFTWSDYAALLKAGVPKALLPRLYRQHAVGCLDIAIRNGRWQRMFRGERAIVVPVFGADGGVLDLVAFRVETPRSFWLYRGEGRFLGETSIYDAEVLRKPLVIRETILEWLRQACTGLVILDWKQLWPFWFANVPALQFEDRDFAAVARGMLERPFNIPPVLVPAI